jgi:hypothetical protein
MPFLAIKTDTNGGFHFSTPPGTYYLAASKEGLVSTTLKHELAHENQSIEKIILRLSEKGLAFQGQVIARYIIHFIL